MYSLQEVIKIIEIDRSTIQKYENEGIALKPSIRNNRGHLRYGEEEIKRLWQIKFYKELGKNMPEIKAIIMDTNYNLKEELPKIIDGLNEKKKKLERNIEIAEILFSNPYNTSEHFFEYLTENKESYEKSVDTVLDITGDFTKIVENLDQNEIEKHIIVKEYETFNKLNNLLIEISQTNSEVSNIDLDKKISEIICVAEKELCKELDFLPQILKQIINEMAEEQNIEETELIKITNKISNIIEIFKKNNKYKSQVVILDEVINLASKKYSTNSKEVQYKIQEFVELCKIKCFDDYFNNMIIKEISNCYLNGKIKKIMDGDVERGYSWFIGRSIETYLENERK